MNTKMMIDPIDQYVIDFVRKLRTDHKLRQQDIAAILNTSNSFIGNIENTSSSAKYNLRHINILANHFKISPTDFLPEKPLL